MNGGLMLMMEESGGGQQNGVRGRGWVGVAVGVSADGRGEAPQL